MDISSMHPATQPLIPILMSFFSVLAPQKMWYTPDQPISISVNAPVPVTMVLTDFTNRALEPNQPVVVTGTKVIDARALMPDGLAVGTYVLYAVPQDKARKDFIGTPLVINVREDKRAGAPPGPMVVRVQPLCYAKMTTEMGSVTLGFYYDVAPHTVTNFLTLARERFYDGLTFHRVQKDFVIQGGDPRGDGTGGPGYFINAEFNDRPMKPGVIAMARSVDPNEAGGAPPRVEFANSAGSQFFICLDYNNTQQLDKRYTAFAKVMEGMETVKKIADVPIADPVINRPKNPPKIQHIEVIPVTSDHNPYIQLMEQTATPSMLPQLQRPPEPGTTLPAALPTIGSTTPPTTSP
jgi:cyclophilin family peptidyl-prolyl cis-trans isomerase